MEAVVSRAFVNEDADGRGPARSLVPLPKRDDPGYDAAAAEALLEGARMGETGVAEDVTGYRWGEPRLAQLADRFLG